MQKSFDEVVEEIVRNDSRFDRGAYEFVKEALEFSIKQKKRAPLDSNSHVTAAELLDGFRQYALKEFGPMAMTVFEHWRVRSSQDVGDLVYHLIHAGIFGKTDTDFPEDFHQGFDFYEAFEAPFQNAKSNATPSK
jgi:uncharacterized repeat protein (TIGR04138 family)